MSHIKRRQFLQFAGSTLATIGFSQFDLIKQGDHYGKVLAQSTPRKLALLVGINSYPEIKGLNNLEGCENDVDLQQKLLIHRFGFNPSDIKILKSKQATREGILTAFNTHLIEQAKSGDVVVFHFSGHGSRIADPDKISPDGLNGTFLPADASPLREKCVVNDIMGRTLFLLMSALKQKTENVTVVLDSCHSGGGTRGNVRIRAAGGGTDLTPSPAELEYQQTLMKQLGIFPQNLPKDREMGVATGVVLAAAGPTQSAADYGFPGFHAGAFTYLLTQYLWQQTSSVESIINKVSANIRPLSNQVPLLDVKPNSGNEKKPVYLLDKQNIPAEAVITQINGNEATLWLGGISPDSLEAFDKDAAFITVASGGRGVTSTKVEVISRDGLVGKAIVNGNAQPGELLQEFARAIPSDWKLQIGLDPSLGAEAKAAKEALQALNRTESLLSQPGNKPYPKEVHYILSRMTAAYRQQSQQAKVEEIPQENSIGLFSPALELIPKSFGQPGEKVPQAITRLKQKLKSLLAARIVKMTLNADSSRLKVGVEMILEGQVGRLIAQEFTPRGCQGEPTSCPPYGSRGDAAQQLIQKMPTKAPFQFKVKNGENIALYLSILLIDQNAGIVVLFPNDYQQLSDKEREEKTRIEPNKELLIPDPKDPFQIATKAVGVGEVLVIASPQPLTKALLTLQSLASKRGPQRGPVETRGDDAVNVIDDLIADLSVAKRGEANEPVVTVIPRIPTSQMAALSITFEIVEKI